MRRRSNRPGFTLLEVLLSSAIAVLLMAALYVAVDVQLRHAQAGRDIVEQSTLARALLARIAHDLLPTVGPPLPVRTSSGSGGGGGGAPAAATGASGSTTPATGGSTPTTGTSGTGGTTTSPQPAAVVTTSSAVQCNIGIQGDATQLVVFASGVPRDRSVASDIAADNPARASDLRRIRIWLAGGVEAPLGLARQEIKLVTSDEATSEFAVVEAADEPAFVIAEEVRSLTFSYFDGTDWLESWDSTEPGQDGMTAKGPPLAVAVVLGLAVPGTSAGGEPVLKFYRHVIPIPTANGLPSQTTTVTTGMTQ